MRPHLLSAVVLAAAGLAVAAPAADAERVAAGPGLAIVELTDGKCAVGLTEPKVAATLSEYGIATAAAPRTREGVDRWLGPDGVATGTVRIAFRDGVEVERACGCASVDAVNLWLSELAAGSTHRAELRRTAESATDVPPVGTWLELAYAEQCSARPDDAFRVLRFLWDQIPARWPDQRAFRLTRVALELGKSADRSPAHRAELVALRDSLTATRERDIPTGDDWVALNRVLHDDDTSLAWFGELRTVPTLASLAAHHGPTAWSLLAERERWVDAGGWVTGDLSGWVSWWLASDPRGASLATGYATVRARGDVRSAAAIAKEALGRDDAPAGLACALIARSTALGVVGKDEGKLARRCDDEAVVDAWSAALP